MLDDRDNYPMKCHVRCVGFDEAKMYFGNIVSTGCSCYTILSRFESELRSRRGPSLEFVCPACQIDVQSVSTLRGDAAVNGRRGLYTSTADVMVMPDSAHYTLSQ